MPVFSCGSVAFMTSHLLRLTNPCHEQPCRRGTIVNVRKKRGSDGQALLYRYLRAPQITPTIFLQNTEKVDFSYNPLADPKFSFYDHSLVEAVKLNDVPTHRFFRLLSLCHTVMPEEKKEGEDLKAQDRVIMFPLHYSMSSLHRSCYWSFWLPGNFL